MIVKKVQNDQNQNILLIVHDEKGNADSLIDKLYTFLEDQVIYHQSGITPTQNLHSRYFLSEVTEVEDRSSEIEESDDDDG
jgi:hypothetical protein